MDVQMPVMDGYEATRLIRSNPAFNGIPIIAMTANSMEQDLELARKAGMVSHVAKPVNPALLYATLAEFIKPNPAKPFDVRKDDGRKTTLKDRGSESLPKILPGIDLADGLGHLAGNSLTYARLLGQFAERQCGTATALREALKRGSRDEATRLAHTLKAVAGNLGAKDLSEAAKLVESALKEGKKEGALLDPLIDLMTASLGEVISGLEAWAASTGHGAAVPAGIMDAATFERLLGTLEMKLRDDDTAAIDVIDELAAGCAPDLSRKLAALRKHAENYDFEAALAGLAGLHAKTGSTAGEKGDNHG